MTKLLSKALKKQVIYPVLVVITAAAVVGLIAVYVDRFQLKAESHETFVSKEELKTLVFTKEEIIRDYPTKKYLANNYLSIASANITRTQVQGIEVQLKRMNSSLQYLIKLTIETNRRVTQKEPEPLEPPDEEETKLVRRQRYDF